MTASPARLSAGNPTTLTIAGFPMNTQLRIELDGARVSSVSDYTDNRGTLGKAITIPKTLVNGPHQIVVTDPYGHRAQTTITLGGAAAKPTLTITPDAGVAGVAVSLHGTNWENRQHSVRFKDAAGRVSNLAITDCNNFNRGCDPNELYVAAQVPGTAAPGVATVTVSDGLAEASVPFRVVSPVVPPPSATPTIVLQPGSGPAGTWITINGAGFPKNIQVVLKWDKALKVGRQVMHTDDRGSFSGWLFQVPDGATGTHTITVLDGGIHAAAAASSQASAVFTVTRGSTPVDPDQPKPPDSPASGPAPANCAGIPSYAQPPECKQNAGPNQPGPVTPNRQRPANCDAIPVYAQPPECKQGVAPKPPEPQKPDSQKPGGVTPGYCQNIPIYAQPPECKAKK